MSKSESTAAAQADEILKLMLPATNALFGSNPPFWNESSAQDAAKAIAKFRATLIEELKTQA